jgi:tetrapyrrole methylase family protein/MazG family protein
VEDPELSPPPLAMADLLRIIERLRGPGGCPWDREQTARSMVRYLLEETYELADAVASDAAENVCEELGDVLFHVLFIARMHAEAGAFTLADVCRAISDKMIRRHPHVFGSTTVADSDEVVRNWRRIKQGEKNNHQCQSVLDSVPASMPSLMRAFAVSERAARARFDWQDMDGVLAKLGEEVAEFREALRRGMPEEVCEEFGDVLFTLVNVGRFAGVHPEAALAGAARKFEKRFRQMEQVIGDSGRELESVPQSEKDHIWESIKVTA